MPITYADHLLPPGATQLERVLSAAGRRVQDIPVSIDRLKRPQQVPVQFLPHLAFEFSVDVWDRFWPEAQKRVVTDAAIPLHGRKGTAYVLREYIRYAGGEVVSITKPPQRVFSGPSITPAAREAWLAGLPQVRTWLIQEQGTAPRRKLFSGSRARSQYANPDLIQTRVSDWPGQWFCSVSPSTEIAPDGTPASRFDELPGQPYGYTEVALDDYSLQHDIPLDATGSVTYSLYVKPYPGRNRIWFSLYRNPQWEDYFGCDYSFETDTLYPWWWPESAGMDATREFVGDGWVLFTVRAQGSPNGPGRYAFDFGTYYDGDPTKGAFLTTPRVHTGLKWMRPGTTAPQFRKRQFTAPSTALSRLHRRARWVVGGAETAITVTDFGTWFRLHMPSIMGKRVFSDARPRRRRFFIPSEAWRRLVTIRPTESLPWRVAVTPSLQAVQSRPDRVAVPSSVGRRVVGHHPPHRRFFVPTSAPMRLFDRYAVFDGTSPARRRPVQFMGTSRYGFPVHTAEVAALIKARRHRLAAGDGIIAKRKRFWMPHDPAPLGRVMRAAQAAKRLSDRVLLDIGPRPRFVAGRPFFAETDRLVIGRP